jgi:hypothetical protein
MALLLLVAVSVVVQLIFHQHHVRQALEVLAFRGISGNRIFNNI